MIMPNEDVLGGFSAIFGSNRNDLSSLNGVDVPGGIDLDNDYYEEKEDEKFIPSKDDDDKDEKYDLTDKDIEENKEPGVLS